MNNNIVENRWKYTRKELSKFRNEYLKLNKNTQDKIQDLFNSLNITYQDLAKVIPKREQDRLERKIDSWKQKKIFKGYFKYRVEELMKGRISYRNLIEILLYGIEIEEQEENKDSIYNLFINCSLDCYNQGRKDLKKKEKSILPQVLLTTFLMTAVNGTMWKDYIDAYYLTNMQEIQKRYLISLQQGKIPNIYDDTWQRIFEIQQNRLIDINSTKYSGGIDKYVTTYGNLAYLEASDNDNQQVKFVSDLCDNVTEMCSYMDGMIFNTKNRNVFKRPMGKTVKDLTLQTIDVVGLVLGINLPPIEEHFHWCHSVLTYITDKSADELRKKSFYTSWFEKLDKNEKRDLLEYISSGSYTINEALYNNRVLTKEQLNFRDSLDGILTFIPKYKGIVYRSVYIESQQHLNKILEPFNNKERIGSWNSYLSTSKDIYDETMNLQFKINSFSGRDISNLNNEGGGEILFERNILFKLVEIKRKNGKIFVELEEVE